MTYSYCRDADNDLAQRWNCVKHGYKTASAAQSCHLKPDHYYHRCNPSYTRFSNMALANLTSAVNATMRAVLWEGSAYNVTVADVPRPSIINATDAIVKLSRAAICGSDLHIYRGTNPGPATPWILGHEGIGYVSEVGEGVGSLTVGDSVIIPFTTAEGHVHDSLTTQMYGGYGNGGGMGGTQGQF